MFEKGNQYGKRERKITDRKKKRVYLSLLENIFGISRQSIKNECCKMKIDLSDEIQVALYIKKKWKCKK